MKLVIFFFLILQISDLWARVCVDALSPDIVHFSIKTIFGPSYLAGRIQFEDPKRIVMEHFEIPQEDILLRFSYSQNLVTKRVRFQIELPSRSGDHEIEVRSGILQELGIHGFFIQEKGTEIWKSYSWSNVIPGSLQPLE